jgi:hypothetical protein
MASPKKAAQYSIGCMVSQFVSNPALRGRLRRIWPQGKRCPRDRERRISRRIRCGAVRAGRAVSLAVFFIAGGIVLGFVRVGRD